MADKQIKITYSNGEEDEFFINERSGDDTLIEALKNLDRKDMDDIYGDVKEDTSWTHLFKNELTEYQHRFIERVIAKLKSMGKEKVLEYIKRSRKPYYDLVNVPLYEVCKYGNEERCKEDIKDLELLVTKDKTSRSIVMSTYFYNLQFTESIKGAIAIGGMIRLYKAVFNEDLDF